MTIKLESSAGTFSEHGVKCCACVRVRSPAESRLAAKWKLAGKSDKYDDNNKDQFDFCSKMQKRVLIMP